MDKQKEKLKQMLEEERVRVKGYEEVAKLHNAYISILLSKLNATEDNAVTISLDDVSYAMSHFETRAYIDEKKGEWKLYCVEKE